MSPDDHLLTNRKQSLIWSKQTPDPSVQFLVNMQTRDKFDADEQLRIGWPYANANLLSYSQTYFSDHLY